jgi:hypothetical protein
MRRGGTCCWDGKQGGQLNGSSEGEHPEIVRCQRSEDARQEAKNLILIPQNRFTLTSHLTFILTDVYLVMISGILCSTNRSKSASERVLLVQSPIIESLLALSVGTRTCLNREAEISLEIPTRHYCHRRR